MISYFLLNEEAQGLKAEGAKNVSDLAKDIIPLNFHFGDGVYRVRINWFRSWRSRAMTNEKTRRRSWPDHRAG
ncbi:MAG: hypothetical protein WCF81_14785 [Roseiarcus sp.]